MSYRKYVLLNDEQARQLDDFFHHLTGTQPA
jgi:hypothetical protein